MKKNRKPSLYQTSYQKNLIHATVASTTGINNKDRLIKAYGSLPNRIEILQKLKKQSKFTLWWFTTFILLGAVCLVWDFQNSWFNVFDLYMVMFNVYLIAKGKLSGIYVGILECLIYALICYKTNLFGEVIKVLCISVPLNIYSIVAWTKNIKQRKKEKFVKSEDEDVVIKKMTKAGKVGTSFAFIFVSVICYLFLKYLLGQTAALELGAISLAIIIIGKILTAKQYMETYAVFIVSDFIGLFMWLEMILVGGFEVASLSMIIYYFAMVFNDIYAYGLWKAMYRKTSINGGGMLFAKRKVNIKRIIKLRRQFRNLKWNREVDVNKNS